MDSVRIDLDGRFVFWRSKKFSPKSRFFPSANGEAWILFLSLPGELKVKYLLYLGLSHVINSEKSPKPSGRARRGTKGITAYGRSLIRCGAQYLQDRFGVTNLSFLTCTLPETSLAVCTPSTWAEVVNRFLKSLRYHLTRVGLCPEIVGCIEVQEGRLLKSSGRPPLHLHLVFQGREGYSQWKFPPRFFREQWEQSCQSVWCESTGFQSSTRIESVHSSAVSYLGKYMSKGGDVLSLCKPELLPSAWYTISTELKKIVKAAEFKCTGELASALYEWLYRSDLCLWCRNVMSPESEIGISYTLAWIGQIASRDDYWWIVNDSRDALSARATAL